MKQIIFFLLQFLVLPLVLSCSTFGTSIPDSKIFRKTIKIEIAGVKGRGMIVVPKKTNYTLTIKQDERSELIKINNCHMDIVEKKSGFFNRKKHVFKLKPFGDLELDGYCPIQIGLFDMQGQHAWGLVEIQNEELPATIVCNTIKPTKTRGVSVCQARVGLVQRIIFKSKVSFDQDGNCGDIITEDKKTFDYFLLSGICVTTFYEKKSDTFHRHTSFGYNDVILKSIKSENRN